MAEPADQSPPPRSACAGLVSRVAALVIDVVVLTVIGSLAATLAIAAWRTVLLRTPPAWFKAVVTAWGLSLPWVYFGLSWAMTGQTPGAMVIGIAVRDPAGRPLGLVRALARSALGLALAPLWLAGLAAVLWEERRRAWLDRVTGTCVVYHTRGAAVTVGGAPAAAGARRSWGQATAARCAERTEKAAKISDTPKNTM